MEQDNRYIKIILDDAIVKATNEDGSEKLRLGIKVDGHEVLVRFPSYGDWDFYVQDLAKLMLLLSKTAADIELDVELVPDKYFPQWSFVVSEVLKIKQCRKLVDKIFFDYLKPDVEGIDGDIRAWLGKHMEISHVYYMFQSILHIEEWLKKKAMEVVQKTFQIQTQPSSKDTSQKSLTSPPNPLEAGQPFAFD